MGRAYASELRSRIPAAAPRVARRGRQPTLVSRAAGRPGAGSEIGRMQRPSAGHGSDPRHLFQRVPVLRRTEPYRSPALTIPPDYNGIKLTMGKASIHGDGIQRLRRRILGARSDRRDRVRRGCRSTPCPTWPTFPARFRLSRPLKVVVDCGNGTGSVVAPQLLEAIGLEVVHLYCESDGTFPNHHPDPTVDEHVQDLIAEVRRHEGGRGHRFRRRRGPHRRGGRQGARRSGRHPPPALRPGPPAAQWGRTAPWSST